MLNTLHPFIKRIHFEIFNQVAKYYMAKVFTTQKKVRKVYPKDFYLSGNLSDI